MVDPVSRIPSAKVCILKPELNEVALFKRTRGYRLDKGGFYFEMLLNLIGRSYDPYVWAAV